MNIKRSGSSSIPVLFLITVIVSLFIYLLASIDSAEGETTFQSKYLLHYYMSAVNNALNNYGGLKGVKHPSPLINNSSFDKKSARQNENLNSKLSSKFNSKSNLQAFTSTHLNDNNFRLSGINSKAPILGLSNSDIQSLYIPNNSSPSGQFSFNLNEMIGNDTNKTDSGKQEVKKDQNLNKLVLDTNKIKLDTSKTKKDTIKIDLLKQDSTARMKYFTYQRKDKPYISLKPDYKNPFIAEPSETVKKRIIELDSTGQFVYIKELVANQQTKLRLKVPLADYLKGRLAVRDREGWEDLAHDYKIKEKKSLGELIKDITDFEIPLPSVGVLSIFGEPKISLRISGAVDIKGGWRSETSEGITASRLGNTRNEPDFKQTVAINVNGTIGDKLSINADWNTERPFEYENQLKIKYTGYDDEIIQSIEAGNVSLQTSSLVGGGEALFGVKTVLKMGPLTLTGLASQKKGEIKEVSVSSGSTNTPFSKRATEYSTNHFFVDAAYADSTLNLFNKYYGQATPYVDPNYQIYEIEVWKSITQATKNPNERNANCFIDLPTLNVGDKYGSEYRGTITGGDGKTETGRFVLLTEADYDLHPETGWITLKTQVNDADIIAVSFRTITGNQSKYHGELLKNAVDSVLILKLVKPRNLQPAYNQAWQLQLKNIYRIGATNINKEGFDFQIKREIAGQEPVSNLGNVNFLNAFGLDLYDESSQAHPDNKFDWRPGYTIMSTSGEIIFPTLFPFGKDLPNSLDSSYKYNDIYVVDKSAAEQNKARDKWVFTGQSSGGIQSVYSLGYNIVENSVKVRLNGRELVAGVDYVVDYTIGQLTIRNDAALVPGANLSITFEQNDLFQLASKTLLGLRGMFDFSEKTKLGFSYLNLNQQTLNDKVRIGEEPLSNTIFGLDFQTGGDLPFLTKTLDKIIPTKEMSSFSLSGEYAYMSPDPNTKKSTIASDMGKSIAYIDDFEGSKKTIPVGIGYTSWKDISVPNRLQFLSDTLTEDSKMHYKGKSFWFNITPTDVKVADIWGERKKVAKEDESVTVLDYMFLPDSTGSYNYNPVVGERQSKWGGIMKPLSSTANNLIRENIQYIEFWMKSDQLNLGDKLYIDLGRISEDVIPNKRLDTEDKNQNGIIDPNEDVGLDGLDDNQERSTFGSTESDPSHDNFGFPQSGATSIMDYYNINGTEGNAILTDNGKLPDTEDLNRNNNLDLVNSYYRYEVPLDTVASRNRFIVGSGYKGWYLYRIPIRDTSMQVGSPHFENIETIRLFVHGLQNSFFHVRLAEFNLVGNQWEKLNGRDSSVQKDTTLQISVINKEDNPEYYSPPGVMPERDRSKPDQEVYRNEQALNLIVSDLIPGDSRDAVKYLYQPLNVFDYSEMKLFVHGDEDIKKNISVGDTLNGGKYNAEIYFKFGSDTNNYYEYRQPIRPYWNEIDIKFADLTALKQTRSDSVNKLFRLPVPGKKDHYFGVKGNPTLTSVKYLNIGVYNATREQQSIPVNVSGNVWVNELRVVGANDHPGWAVTLQTALKLADFINLSFNYSFTDPYFHRLSDRFGSKVEQTNWGMSADVDIIKMLPLSLPESNLRLNYSHTESVGKPLYIPGTDIEVEKAVEQLKNRPDSLNKKTADQIREETKTLSTSDSYSASNIKVKIPTDYWLVRDTWNAITLGFNYNKTYQRSPTVAYQRSWIWNATADYNLNFSPDYYFFAAKIPALGSVINMLTDYRSTKIYFTPQTFNAKMSARRSRLTTLNRDITGLSTQVYDETISRDFAATRGFNFSWRMTENALFNISTSYNVDILSTLAYLETDGNNLQRKDSKIWKDIFSGVFFGKDYQFTQSIDIKTQPRLPSLWDIKDYFSISAGYNVGFQWGNDLKQVDLGRSAGYDARSNVMLTLRLKALTAPLFQESKDVQTVQQTTLMNSGTTVIRTWRDREQEIQMLKDLDSTKYMARLSDTTTTKSTTDNKTVTKKSATVGTALMILKNVARVLLFDYDNISISFNNSNKYSSSGLRSEKSGFKNFWGFATNNSNGPSRLYMMGLSSDVGPRALNGNLQDVAMQNTSFDIRTSKPLWEGAKIDLNWKVGWSNTKTTSLSTDSLGVVTIKGVNSTGSITRSFLSLPPTFFLSIFKSGIKKVNELYDHNITDQGESNRAMTKAFEEGFESLPLLSKVSWIKSIANYIPRVNWHVTWDGLEKFFPFKNIAKRVSFEHGYNSDYSEGYKSDIDGTNEVQSQGVTYAFAPLAGINITFNDLWGGNLSGNIKYNTKSDYRRNYTQATKVNETFTKEIGITANYSKQGFEIPLFGLSLKNDIEFSFSYNNSKNSVIEYDFQNFTEEGTPRDGSTKITIEPRVRYTISSRVTVSIYYRRSSTSPEGSSAITATTTNEAGLEVHISIQ